MYFIRYVRAVSILCSHAAKVVHLYLELYKKTPAFSLYQDEMGKEHCVDLAIIYKDSLRFNAMQQTSHVHESVTNCANNSIDD